MDLSDIKLRLGISRSNSLRDKSTVLLNVYTLQFILKAVILLEVTTESRLTLHSDCLNYPVNQEICKAHNLLQPFEVTK